MRLCGSLYVATQALAWIECSPNKEPLSLNCTNSALPVFWSAATCRRFPSPQLIAVSSKALTSQRVKKRQQAAALRKFPLCPDASGIRQEAMPRIAARSYPYVEVGAGQLMLDRALAGIYQILGRFRELPEGATTGHQKLRGR